MRLIELEPRWLIGDGKRVGFIFKSPTKPHWYQSCLFAPTPPNEQHRLFNEALELPEPNRAYGWTKVQGCNAECGWTVDCDVGTVLSFDTISISPSIDGSAGGLWHGFIKNGQIVGGL